MSRSTTLPPLSVCLINWQGASRLRATLDALKPQLTATTDAFVVDSASTDRSLEVIRDVAPSLDVVRLSSNRGPAHARNAGLDRSRHRRVLFLDNDIALEPGCIATLVAALDADPDATIAMPRVRLRARPERIQFAGADTHMSGFQLLRSVDQPVAEADERVVACSSMVSACFLLDRDRPGGDARFAEDFAFDYEDHDFGRRVSVAGGRILAVHAASCLHGEGTAGRSVRGGRAYPPGRMEGLVRGRWVVVLTTFQARSLFALAPLLALHEALIFVFAVRRRSLSEWYAAARWIVRHRAELGARRKAVARRRTVGDQPLLFADALPFRPGLGSGRVDRALLGVLRWVTRAYGWGARRMLRP